ncbi:hypothetical protein K503DRAFT_866597 [Rhizopogon vinicolor AM-OR11-026]|uniref:Cora-domain-containing protein n=1 Tax=Rhizopogon vinicolor AM-OR11-026 TaxID=1314800 RepID=A0A1B7MYZ1_9AGAM|nr:hypothetical protein K503DRAFT_866597 [Rhizopogon vinicolor AM-OR11-026]
MDPLSCQPLLPTDLDDLPGHRHAAPSGPWPWIDFSTVDDTTAISDATVVMTDVTTATADTTVVMTDVTTATADGSLWRDYPQNKFKNWTPEQVERSQMLTKCSKNQSSTIYWVDVGDDGRFTTPDMRGDGHTSENQFWAMLKKERPGGIRVRSLSVDHLTSPVLRMLGTIYMIEPFFFTSSINWIPSRYQEMALGRGKEDHITITLPFVRTIPQGSKSRPPTSTTPHYTAVSQPSKSIPANHIDPKTPLPLHNGNMLCMDLLAIHMVRAEKTSTIISYHPESTGPRTSAKRFHLLMMLVGESVYWKNIFSKFKDPTFLFLAILWYALYGWDESLESLHTHVSSLVPAILDSPAEHSCYLHAFRARLLYYELLLDGLRASVSFIEKTPNPAMHCEGIYEAQRKASNDLLKKECGNLLSEIDRLEKRRTMLCNRVKNLLHIVDSIQTNKLVEAAAIASQNSYLTIFFLPISFIASVFWMKFKDITSSGYLEMLVFIALTLFMERGRSLSLEE